MKNARAASRYAKAILIFAQESGDDTKVNQDMRFIATSIAESSDLDQILKSPVVKSSDKKRALMELFSEKTSELTPKIFDLLHENKRMDLLSEIAKLYSVIYDASKRIQIAEVTTAVPLTKLLENKIMDKVVALTGNQTVLKNSVDPKILGGFILRVGDVQYDASIACHLSKLKKEFDTSSFVPKT